MKALNQYQIQADRQREQKHKFTEERLRFLSDIVITAIEGGLNYWADHREYDSGDYAPDFAVIKPPTAEIRENQGDDMLPDWTLLDVYAIECGIQTIINGTHETLKLHPKNIAIVAGASAINDGGDIDADAADWIVQAAMFGEVVYG